MAQLVEQLIRNEQVASSSLAIGFCKKERGIFTSFFFISMPRSINIGFQDSLDAFLLAMMPNCRGFEADL